MFAQLMAEMLNLSTFESFRAYSLDTTARLAEALQTIEDISQNRVPEAVLDPIKLEIEWSLREDDIARSIADDEIQHLVARLNKRSDLKIGELAPLIKLVQRKIKPLYQSSLENGILNIINDRSKRSNLRKMTGFYCSNIVNVGYSRSYILRIVNEFFFERDIQRIGRSTLSRFFRQFDGSHKKFVVHASVSDDFGYYLNQLGYSIHNVSNLEDEQIDTFALEDDYEELPLAIEFKTNALDPDGAMDVCYQFLSAQRAISYLDPFGMKCKWSSRMHVTRSRSKSGEMVEKSDLLSIMPRLRPPRPAKRARTISNYTSDIISNFDAPSTERLLSSIDTAALARTSLSPENRLISLWSAIEVLLSEPRGDARIVHYARLITPCITIRHPRRQFTSVYQELLIPYRHRLNKLLRRVPTFPDIHAQRALAELLLVRKYEYLRDELCHILKDNPLALHRVWRMRRDYEDTKTSIRTIRDHFDRVSWQIHRIYRARNQLVHAGRMPTYLDSITVNLAEYYRSAIASIVAKAKEEQRRSDIDQVVAEIGFRYEITRDRLGCTANTDLTSEQVELLMDSKAA